MKLKFSLVLLVLFLRLANLMAQEAPPPAAMPDADNAQLIDSIIKITKHEYFFVMFCKAKVNKHAALNQWSKERTDKVLRSIKFKYYSSTIYNSYARYTSKELKQIIEVLTILNKGASEFSSMILTNPMMQHNLDGFVEGVIAEKYITE